MTEQSYKLLNAIKDSRYISAFFALCVVGWVLLANQKLSTNTINVINHPITKTIFVIALIAITIKYGIVVSGVLTLVLFILYALLNTILKEEKMASIDYDMVDGIPAFVNGRMTEETEDIDEPRGEHGELITSDGPITGVSDEEIQSLYMHVSDGVADTSMSPVSEISNVDKILQPQKMIKNDYAIEYNKELEHNDVVGHSS